MPGSPSLTGGTLQVKKKGVLEQIDPLKQRCKAK